MKRKNTTPSYIVNCDNIVYYEDIAKEFAMAKHRAGIPLTDDELEDICENYKNSANVKVTFAFYIPNRKKVSLLKRIWNKITRVFAR